MPEATIPGGELIDIENCYIFVPGRGKIVMHSLPDITDSKSASYNDEPIIGRSFPLKTFSHSENRSIGMQVHFYVRKRADIGINIWNLRALESALYPRGTESGINAPFIPPPVCKIKCGSLLADDELCVILKSCSVKFPTDVPWDEEYLVPYKFDVDLSWEVVYRTSQLPGQSRILISGG